MASLDKLLGRSERGDWHSGSKWKRGLSAAALDVLDALSARYVLQPTSELRVFRDRFDEYRIAVSEPPLDFELRLGPRADHFQIQFWAWEGRDMARVPSIDDPTWRTTFLGDDWEGVRAGRFALTQEVIDTPEMADALPELCAIVRRFSDAVDEVMYSHPGIAVTMDAHSMSAETFAADLHIARAFCERARQIDFDASNA